MSTKTVWRCTVLLFTLATSWAQAAGPLVLVGGGLKDDLPQQFPVFAKPRINLHGLGHGTAILRNAVEGVAA